MINDCKLNELKAEYNELIKRINKAIEYFEKAEIEKAVKWVDEYNKLEYQSCQILKKINKLGYIEDINERLNGFKIGSD